MLQCVYLALQEILQYGSFIETKVTRGIFKNLEISSYV